MGIRSRGIIDNFAVIVVIPGTEVDSAILCGNAVHLGIGMAVDGYVFTNRADQHARITVCVVLIVGANVVVNVHLSGNVAVFEVNTAIYGVFCGALTAGGIVLTHDTAASHVIRAPQGRNLVGIINGDVCEGGFQASFLGIPANTADNTAVADVIDPGIAVKDCNIFKGCAVCVSCNNAGSSNFTVRGEVLNGQVLDRAAVYTTEQTHTIPVILLLNRIVPVMVALHFPGVLVEIGDGMTVTVESTAEVIEAAFNRIYSLLCGQSFVSTFIIPITDGVENELFVVFAFLIAQVNVSDQLYGLTGEGILLDARSHIANNGAESRQLVSVCDGQLGLGSIVPSVIKLTLPGILGICNHRNLGEGRHSQNHVAGSRIVAKFIVLCRGIHLGHFLGDIAFHMVELIVAQIQTSRCNFRQRNQNRSLILRRHTVEMHVQGAHILVLAQNDVRAGGFHLGNGHDQLGSAGLQLSALLHQRLQHSITSQTHCALAIGEDNILCQLIFSVNLAADVCGQGNAVKIRECNRIVVVASKAIVLITHLGCDQIHINIAYAEILIAIACALLHM